MRDHYAAMINRTNAYFDLAKSMGIELNADKTPDAHKQWNPEETKSSGLSDAVR